MQYKFIVYARSYDENSGGSIVLHKLCDLINKAGYKALIWPMGKPVIFKCKSFFCLKYAASYFLKKITLRGFKTNISYNTPIAKKNDLEGSIILYPEIISGNPIDAKRYARWFLHKPGFHTGNYRYAPGDLYFTYQPVFNNHDENLIYGGVLTITELLSDIYTCKNNEPRVKQCYMIRKGASRDDLPNLNGKWIVDNLSHHEMANAFNECDRCYFYDEHTMYSIYAALCGCIPIIVPLPGVSKEQWQPDESLRFGIAYGEEDIDYALSSRKDLLEYRKNLERKNMESVNLFIDVVLKHFSPAEDGLL